MALDAPRGQGAPWAHRARAIVLHGAALLLFTVLALTQTLQVTLHPASTVAPDPIDPVFHVWSVASTIQHVTTWADGVWSFFDANIFYPTPHAALYGHVAIGMLPYALPLHALIPNPVVLFNLLVALSFILSAYGVFLLALLLTESYAGALAAGLIFAFSPLRAEQIGHLNQLCTEWLVACACCLALGWRRERYGWWLAAGLLYGLSGVTSMYLLAYLTPMVLVMGLLLYRSWTRRRWRGALLAAECALLLIVPFDFPYVLRKVVIDTRYGAAYNVDLLSFLRVHTGHLIDGALLQSIPIQMTQPDHGFFPGFAALALAAVAWRRRRARYWGIFAALCAVLALGPWLQINGHVLPIPLPYAWLLAVVPHFDLFRDPPRALTGFYLGLAVLAAWGLRDVLALARTRGRRIMLASVLVGLVALETWTPIPTTTLAAIPAGEHWLARQPRLRVLAELPIEGDTPLDWQRQTAIMYDSTVHWKLLVNGQDATYPAGMDARQEILSTYPSPAAFGLLRQLHVDAVVLRLQWLTPRQRAADEAVCRVAYRDTVEEVCLGPWPPAGQTVT